MSRKSRSGSPTYVLGTGLSHDGSACLLKDGQIDIAIEKERITRLKHDGGNDTAAIRYCLDAAGIVLGDLALVVQNANFGAFERGSSYFDGPRLLTDDLQVPVVTISHHLAHAYSALGTCPFDETSILVIDGCGNGLDECSDLAGLSLPVTVEDDLRHLYFEKDSYYTASGGRLEAVFKDFSPWGMRSKGYPMLPPTTKHSIGGVYAAVSLYCFRDNADLGKLMGLAPYGRGGVFVRPIFDLEGGRLFVRYDWMDDFRRPARTTEDFKRNFQYYADIAYWVQREVERALVYLVDSRYEMAPHENLAYAGGVALNAVANTCILEHSKFKHIHMVPAAGDNGIAVGCAYYGWLAVLGRERVRHSGSTCFGRVYPSAVVGRSLGELDLQPHETVVEARSDASPVEEIAGLFDLLQGSFVAARASGWNGRIFWDVTGADGYSTEIRDGRLCWSRGGGRRAGATVVHTDSRTLIGVLQGRFHPARALEFSRLRCSNLDALLAFHGAVEWEAVAAQLNAKQAATHQRPLRYRRDPGFVETAAALLAEGKILAWFEGGAEFGPRALGRRSILADPRRPGVGDWINLQVKRREEFRPFAPAVLREDAAIFFACEFESPYMILVAQVRDEWRETLKSVVHRDGSARLQTVTPDWNPSFHALLTAFKSRTGLPVLLNTSFNRKGMPIVETPENALHFFREAEGLDALIIEDFVVERDAAPLELEESDPGLDLSAQIRC